MSYWHAYHNVETIKWYKQSVVEQKIVFGDESIHIEKYKNKNNNRVIVFCPGLELYSKMLIPIARKLFGNGLDVVIIDPPGEGFSSGKRNSFTMSEVTKSIHLVLDELKKEYDKIFITGISLGGAQAYYAGSSHDAVAAMSVINLFEFTSEQLKNLFYEDIKLLPYRHVLPIASRLAPEYEYKLFNAINFPRREKKEDSAFQEAWRDDPRVKNTMTLRRLNSFLNTPPTISFEKNNTPVIVFNQEKDRLLNPDATRNNYEKLSGEKKYFELKNQPHWSISNEFWDPYISKTIDWFNKHAK